jgi:hypothetical protein
MRNNASRADKCVLSDNHVGKNGGPDADFCARFDCRALHALRAEWMGIVRKHNARRQKDVIFDRRELRDVNVAMNLYARANHAIVIHCRIVPDGAIVPNPIAFPNDDVVPRFKVIADLDRRVDHTTRADLRAISNAQGHFFYRASRWITQNNPGINRTVAPELYRDTVEHSATSTAFPRCAMDASIAFNVRTTASPVAPSDKGFRL